MFGAIGNTHQYHGETRLFHAWWLSIYCLAKDTIHSTIPGKIEQNPCPVHVDEVAKRLVICLVQTVYSSLDMHNFKSTVQCNLLRPFMFFTMNHPVYTYGNVLVAVLQQKVTII